VFVFSAFIEYSIVNTLARRQKSKVAKRKMAAAAGEAMSPQYHSPVGQLMFY